MARVQSTSQQADYTGFAEAFESIARNIERVIEGKPEPIRLALITLVAEGHLLIEDVPGVGKTMLAKSLARSTSCDYGRIQFTPDLLPSDVTGVNVYDGRSRKFQFKPGAIFANIVLGDEINRASPKTQAALLESMEERQVTVDGVTYALDPPFMVIATQNPIEHAGTYPLPESQLDRFMMRIDVGYPDIEHSLAILEHHGVREPIEEIRPVIDSEGLLNLIEWARQVHVADAVKRYIVDLVEATRSHPGIHLGASPRSSLFLLKAARARAASEGRSYMLPDDVKALAVSILDHRVLLSGDAHAQGLKGVEIVSEILETTHVPRRVRSEGR